MDKEQLADKLAASAPLKAVTVRNGKRDVYKRQVLESTTAHVDSAGTLGFYAMGAGQIYQMVTLSYGFFESFPAGIKMGVQTLRDYVAQFKYVFTKEGASSLGGFGAIGSLFPARWNWQAFWLMTCLLYTSPPRFKRLPPGRPSPWRIRRRWSWPAS